MIQYMISYVLMPLFCILFYSRFDISISYLLFMRTLKCGKGKRVLYPIVVLCVKAELVWLFLNKLHVFIVIHDHSRGYMTNFIDLSCPDKTWHKKCRTTTILAWSHCSNNKVTTKYMLGKRETYIIFSLILRLFSISHVYYVWCALNTSI